MVKFVFLTSVILAIFWAILSIYINFTGATLWGLDKDRINSLISILGLLITIAIGYFCWRYAYSDNDKQASQNSRNMKIGDNPNNVIQINGNVKIKK